MTAIDYIRNKGFDHKMQKYQIVLRTCPFCGDTGNHFFMDQTEGIFFCHKCNEQGNLIILQKHLGDYRGDGYHGYSSRPAPPQSGGCVKPAFSTPKKFTILDEQETIAFHDRLLTDQAALRYVTDTRGISMEAVKHFKIGLKIASDGGRWLAIPHYTGGKLINVKYRSLPPAKKAFRRIEGCKSIMLNTDILDATEVPDTVFLCEGEPDAITLWSKGIRNVIGTTTGAGSFDPEWVDRLKDVKKIIICYDNDKKADGTNPGQTGSREVARRLGYDRCFNVLLPEGQDINDFFQTRNGGGHDEFSRMVDEARRFDVAGVMSFQECLDTWEAGLGKIETKGLMTGFSGLDKLMAGGMKPGELLVLGAPPKIGKSTFALQIVTYNALRGNPALFFCLEMPMQEVTEKIVQCHTHTDSKKLQIDGKSEIERTKIDFRGTPLYLGYCHQKPDIEGIIETLKAAIRRYGLKLLVFDHLHYLCRSVTHQTQEISLAVQAFKFLATELETPIILIAQPRKIQEGKIMGAMDLKDSSSIYSDCDHLIILHRDRMTGLNGGDVTEDMETQERSFSPVTLCRVEASRYGAGGETLLYYHGEYSRFDALGGRP